MRAPFADALSADPRTESRRLALGTAGAVGLHALLLLSAAFGRGHAREAVQALRTDVPLLIEAPERLGDGEEEGAAGPPAESLEPPSAPVLEKRPARAPRAPTVRAPAVVPVVASEVSTAPAAVPSPPLFARAAAAPTNSRAAQRFGHDQGSGRGYGGGGRGLFGSGVGSGRGQGAFLARVCEIPTNTRALSRIEVCKYVYEQRIDRIDVPQQRFEHGFPGLPQLMEYFAVDIRGPFTVSEAGTYRFRLKSDDGSQLFIDEELVIDHDGVHGATSKRGEIELFEGRHQLHISYFQGMKYELALQLFVTVPGGIEELFTPIL